MEKAKILVVDDEKNIRESITKILSRKGFEVDCSQDAQEAMTKIDKTSYNLILLDIMMPKISGMDLLKTIRTDHSECNVVMITGYPSVETAVEATKSGAMDYIPKPFTPQELLNVVQRVLVTDDREGFCSKGRMYCAKLEKTGICEGECPKLKQKAKLAQNRAREEVTKNRIDADVPYDYDEVAAATSGHYADMLSRSDIPILGWKRYNEKNQDILVVDDEVVICNSVRKILNASGYNVDQAKTTEEALLKLMDKKYALAIVDLRIPRIGGAELIRQIRQLHPFVKVVVITGYASIGSAIETTKMGAKAYIPKPFTPEELNKKVEEVMEMAA